MRITSVLLLSFAVLLCRSCYGEINDPWAKPASVSKDIQANLELRGGEEYLTITPPHTAQIILGAAPEGAYFPKLCAASFEDNKVAVVLDLDFTLAYRLYRMTSSGWVLEYENKFREIRTGDRRRLCLIELTALHVVQLTFIKKLESFNAWRKYREVRDDDPKEIYNFKPSDEKKK